MQLLQCCYSIVIVQLFTIQLLTQEYHRQAQQTNATMKGAISCLPLADAPHGGSSISADKHKGSYASGSYGGNVMNFFSLSIGFVVICIIVAFLVAKFVVGALPESLRRAAFLQRIIGYGFAFIGVLFLMQWGYDPVIISIGADDMFLDPRRWLWWVLAALFFGVAGGFLFRVKAVDRTKLVEPIE